MERETKLELVHRMLALKHKLKVSDSLPRPDTHEEIALSTLARWELEDELHAIEEILRDARAKEVADKRVQIIDKGVKKNSKKPDESGD